MSDKEKPTQSDPPSSLSSSGLPSTDRSLERVLGAIDKTIRSFEVVVRTVYEEIREERALTERRHQMTSDMLVKARMEHAQRHKAAVELLGKMRLELATLTDQLSSLLKSHDIQLGATVEARAALDRTREKLEDAVEDITGAHDLMRPEDEEGAAPKSVRVFVVKVTNFVWPVAARGGKAAALWGLKLLTGSTALAGIAKIIHDLLVGG